MARMVSDYSTLPRDASAMPFPQWMRRCMSPCIRISGFVSFVFCSFICELCFVRDRRSRVTAAKSNVGRK